MVDAADECASGIFLRIVPAWPSLAVDRGTGSSRWDRGDDGHFRAVTLSGRTHLAVLTWHERRRRHGWGAFNFAKTQRE